MLKTKNVVFAILLALVPCHVFAGAVSSGGGGVTDPKPVKPVAVFDAVRDFGSQALLAWLHAAENEYRESSDPQNHRYAKLFGGTRTIYDVLAVTRVELRFSEPCYNKNGQSMDGSIYAHTAGAVCLSPFTMAPKLNETNVKDETLALVLHEMSHLLDTTEEEAEGIQQDILSDFDRIDFEDFTQKPYWPDFHLELILNYLKSKIRHREDFSHRAAGEFLASRFDQAYNEMRFGGYARDELFLMISPQTQDKIDAYEMLIQYLNYYACSTDPSSTPENYEFCQKRLGRVFQGDEKEITARTFFDRDNSIGEANPEFDKLKIRRIESKDDLIANLQQEVDFLESIRTELKSLVAAGIEVVWLR